MHSETWVRCVDTVGNFRERGTDFWNIRQEPGKKKNGFSGLRVLPNAALGFKKGLGAHITSDCKLTSVLLMF